MWFRIGCAFIVSLILSTTPVESQFDPHFIGNRSVIVHLFEWKWNDVARECEERLGPIGVGGVQVSPPNENSVIDKRPWWERYQPVSYYLETRSGDEDQFRSMVKRCYKVGVRIYADTVINHMSATRGRGTGGSVSDPATMNYPAVPYTTHDFHPPCEIRNYSDPYEVRNCQLVGLPDLNHTLNWVQDRVEEYLNKLVDCGVAGFRVDAAKHMWPEDLKRIYDRVKDLNRDFGFPPGARPFIYQEVIDLGGEGVSKYEYTDMGRVTEFRAQNEIGRAMRGKNNLTFMDSWGPSWGFMPSDRAVVFVENHDSERSGGDTLTYKDGKLYRMGVAFMLAHPFGIPKLMSSFAFNNSDQGPPADNAGNIVSPSFTTPTCDNGWVCQHRWPAFANLIKFRNYAADAPMTWWWTDGNNQIGFARKGRGFIVFNNEPRDLIATLQTGLPEGKYCDIISGRLKDNRCTGYSITVNQAGLARFLIKDSATDGVIAVYGGQRIAF